MNSTHPIRHILVAHDLNECSDAALDYAIVVARSFGARVTVLHAYEIPSMGAPEVLVLATDWTEQFGAVARDSLEKIVARARNDFARVDMVVRQGSPWREVDAYANENAVDLVVVGSHGRHGLPRALLGSVAERIVRTAPCPVLVVRGNERDA